MIEIVKWLTLGIVTIAVALLGYGIAKRDSDVRNYGVLLLAGGLVCGWAVIVASICI